MSQLLERSFVEPTAPLAELQPPMADKNP